MLPGSGNVVVAQDRIPPAITQDPGSDGIRSVLAQRVEQMLDFDEVIIQGKPLPAWPVIPELYRNRQFTRVWSDPAHVRDMLRAIRDMERDGLDPEDYHLTMLQDALRAVETDGGNTELLADFDMLMADALARMAYHIEFGKVDPERLDAHWNMVRVWDGLDPAVYLQRVIDSGRLYAALEDAKPKHRFYRSLKEVLARYREIEAAGGWPSFPAGESIEAGASDPRVPQLRRHLAIVGDFTGDAHDTSQVYDDELVKAVKLFQHRHGLPETGLVGSQTTAALNVPVSKRVDQIRLSLERGRWVLHDLPDMFIVANIAAFRVYFIRDGEPIWESRTQVGRLYRKTPMFKADLEYVQFNPTWTIPPGILSNDVLPRLREDTSYLTERNMRVIDRNGREVDPNSVDWSAYTGRNLPYRIVQAPGPRNSLGMVKFIFPNPYAVFLHDTPSRARFDRSVRTFSSGCVRVENPFELVELLLDDESQWSASQIQSAVDSKETKTVFTDEIAVLLMYWTAEVGLDGHIHFYTDVYERDGAVLDALNGDFRLRDRGVRN